MTDEEKELEEKIKQYKYQKEETDKKLDQLYIDTHKTKKKKSFVSKLSKTTISIMLAWSALGFLLVGGLLIMAITMYIGNLRQYDPVIKIESRYDMNLKILSREAENKVLTYKVKPKSWKYGKVKFTVIQEGTGSSKLYEDFKDNYLKYLIENIKNKELLQGFDILQSYDEYGLLEYKLVYKFNSEQDKEQATKKVNELKQYLMSIDKDMEYLINIENIKMEEI